MIRVCLESGTWSEGDCLVCNCTEDNRKSCALSCNLTPAQCEEEGMVLVESTEGELFLDKVKNQKKCVDKFVDKVKKIKSLY